MLRILVMLLGLAMITLGMLGVVVLRGPRSGPAYAGLGMLVLAVSALPWLWRPIGRKKSAETPAGEPRKTSSTDQ